MIKKKLLKKRILVAVIAAAMVMPLSLTGCNNTSEDNNSSPSSETSESSTVSKFGDNIAVKSAHYSIPINTMSYLFNYQYQNYLSSYSMYMSYYGFDANKGLKEQYCNESEGLTWYDFFMNQTKNDIEQRLVFAEAAKDDNTELDENDKKILNDSFDSIEKEAKENNMTVDEYIAKSCGEGMNKKLFEEFMTITRTAQKQSNKIYNSYKYSDSDYEKYYEENKTSYQYADFLVYTFNADYDENAADEEKQKANKEAKTYADALAKCKTEDEFKAYVKRYLKNNPDLVKTTTSTTDNSQTENSMTDEQIEEAIDAKVERLLNQKYAYDVTSDVGKWVFDGSRSELDTTVVSGTDTYTVVMLLKPSYRDESKTKNVRHILINSSSYSSDEEAKAEADRIYKEWKDGDATEESFALLANKYSEDPGSNTNGGLYKSIYEGQMVQTFNDWCFDSSRKSGDTGIVKTSYGYHIMYFSDQGYPVWKSAVDGDMRNKDLSEEYDNLKNKYNIQFDNDYLNTIDVFTIESEESKTSSEQESSAQESSAQESSAQQ